MIRGKQQPAQEVRLAFTDADTALFKSFFTVLISCDDEIAVALSKLDID